VNRAFKGLWSEGFSILASARVAGDRVGPATRTPRAVRPDRGVTFAVPSAPGSGESNNLLARPRRAGIEPLR